MDYDRYDAFLHHIFKQTQADAWFRPSEEHISTGVCLRIEPGRFRVFPYENLELEPFETAVAALNPVVAVKVRSAAVHAALSDCSPDEKSIYIDANTRIQVVDTMLMLPLAEKEQSAAFIRDERVMVIWSYDIDSIIPTCRDFEKRLLKLLWRSNPPANRFSNLSPSICTPSYPTTASGSVTGHVSVGIGEMGVSPSDLSTANEKLMGNGARREKRASTRASFRSGDVLARVNGADLEKGDGSGNEVVDEVVRRGLFGRRRKGVMKAESRPVRMFAPVYNGFSAALSVYFMAAGVNILVQEFSLDGGYIRFVLIVCIPFLFSVSLFFSLQLVQNLSYAIGPIAQYHENSKYYSAIAPKPNQLVDDNLPHVTVQMPVYKESLEQVLAPSIESIKRAMQTYARQGGSSTIFINDDGLQLLPQADRDARIAYYTNHGIGYVARPPHDNKPGGFKRAGRFKKASNMNYGLRLSLRLEKHLAALREKERNEPGSAVGTVRAQVGSRLLASSTAGANESAESSGSRLASPNPDVQTLDEDKTSLEDMALFLAVEEEYDETGKLFRPWAANGAAIRMGEIVLLVDSDTVVPEDCFRDAAREFAESPTVAVLQHESDVMQVVHHYFENGIAYFTRRINKCISITCANGEVAPFVGHNAFLRWKAIQDAAFVDPVDSVEKIWSESNVSEDFDMALRLQMRGFIIRWATYSKGGFKEGVSLTVADELNRWQKYAYGCSELLFNPIVKWWRKGPINERIHQFVWSDAPLHYKISMLAYMFSYYGLAGSVTMGLINYVVLGLQFPVDGYYMHSFEIWIATTVVFIGLGNVAFTLLEYRLGQKPLVQSFLTNIVWIPFFFLFFGGLGIHLTQAILAHLLSYNMTWAATIKEVEQSNFFEEVPKILKRFWLSLSVSVAIVAGMIVVSTDLVPLQWRIGSDAWAVIVPLGVSTACHILFPIVLNPWLMIFSY